MPIPSIKFRPRTVSNQKPILQCFIMLHGKKAPKFSTQIRISEGLRWRQKEQFIEPVSPEYKELAQSKNLILIQITVTVNNCFTSLNNLGKIVTANSLKAEFERVWNKGSEKPIVPTLLKNFNHYIKSKINENLAPKTIAKYYKTKDHLTNFIQTKSRKDLELEEINAHFGFQFFEYIKTVDNVQQKDKKITASTAKRYLLYLIGSLEYAFSKGLIDTNPLSEVDPKVKHKKSNKTIVTEMEQLSIYRLENLTVTERFVADVTTFLFYTAFDFCDLYDFEQKKHIKIIDGIRVVQKVRFKMKKSEEPEIVTIPINNILHEILCVKYLDYFPIYSYNTVLRIYKNLCSRIGVKNYKRMSLKQIRKSGGSYYLNNGVDLKTVSAKVFGHTEQSITETKYAVIEDSTIIREAAHLLIR